MRENPFLPRRANLLSDRTLTGRIREYSQMLAELRAFEGPAIGRTAAQLEEGLVALKSEARARRSRAYDRRVHGAAYGPL